MTIHSGRKVRNLEREKERKIMPSTMATTFCLSTPKGSARTPLGPIIVKLHFLSSYILVCFCSHSLKDSAWQNSVGVRILNVTVLPTYPTYQPTQPTQIVHTLCLLTVSVLVHNWHSRKAQTITHSWKYNTCQWVNHLSYSDKIKVQIGTQTFIL